MNQSLTYELGQVLPQLETTNLLVSLCTIQQRSNTLSAVGQLQYVWVNVPGLVGIKCMISIQRPYSPNQGAVVRTPVQFDTETMYHVLLDGYFPQILQKNQAVVDGNPYEIMAVESDSQRTQTRLALRKWTL